MLKPEQNKNKGSTEEEFENTGFQKAEVQFGSIGRTMNMVRETKGVKKEDFLKLRTSEADKINCGKKHFEALDVPFDVVVSAKHV